MSKKVTIILLEDLANYGKAGDIIDVSEGYARNFLFPQTKAALATNQVKEQAERKKDKELQIAEKDLANAQKEAEGIDGMELTIFARIKENNEIFGKITERDVSKALGDQAGLKIGVRNIELTNPMINIGSYDVTINLSSDIEAKIKVNIEVDPASLPKKDNEE